MSAVVSTSIRRFLSERAKRLAPSPIRELIPLTKLPGMLSLGGGLPNPETFPITALQVSLRDVDKPLEINTERMSIAQQYSPSFGITLLVDWLRTLQTTVHRRAVNEDWNICVWTGSQHAMSVAFDCLINEGDPVLVENPTYSGALASLKPLNARLIPIETDEQGLSPTSLKALLKGFTNEERKPRVLYTIPTGQNPSGCSTSTERKKQIYEIASQHDLLILEDDPYFYLDFESAPRTSYFELDRESRVLRFDSFSKIVSSGLRVGFCTGPSELVETMQLHQQASTLHPSGLSQMVLFSVLEYWKMDGFFAHVKYVSSFYRKQRDAAVASAKKHLKGLATFSVPTAGMFLWIRANNVNDTHTMIKEGALEKKVLCVSGQSFSPTGEPSPYLRASYSTATPEQMDQAFERLAQLLKSHQ